MKLPKIYLNIYINLAFLLTITAISSSIPPHLIKCYNGDVTTNLNLPCTVPVLVDLINRIEVEENAIFNIRMLTIALLHGVMFDGIQESQRGVANNALPFRAKGHEFYKYDVVVNYLVSGNSGLFINDSLAPDELCQLHYILSSTVDSKVRGDEGRTCYPKNFTSMPIPYWELQTPDTQNSICPIIKGNINAKWGTINSGHIIYAVAASLQDSKPSFSTVIKSINKNKFSQLNNTVNSLWISTIAGDLAEVVLNQANDKLKIGSNGFWNNPNFPTLFYLANSYTELPETKILGGIDGIILAKHLIFWKEYLEVTRFSQIIDMYYSKNGVVFNNSIKASNRNALFMEILQELDVNQIVETSKFFMEIGSYDNLLSDADLEKLSSIALGEFQSAADKLTKHYDNIDYIDKNRIQNPLELILILDGSFDYNASLQIIYSLVEAAQVSFYDTKLGIINGENGQWIANVTGRLFHLFAGLEKAKLTWPTQLNLHRSFQTINAFYQNKTYQNCTLNKRPLGKAILILSNNARLTDSDMLKSREVLLSIKNTYPETNVIYVLPEDMQKGFEYVTAWFKNVTFINVTDSVSVLTENIMKEISKVPGEIVDLYCEGTKIFMEDYLTPFENRFYEIYESYLTLGSYDIKFRGNDYGEINICAIGIQSSVVNRTCNILTVNNEVTFYSNDLCPVGNICNLQFNLNVTSSNFRCAENECRFPNQVRLGITWSKSGSSTLTNHAELLVLVVILIFGSINA